MAEPSRRWIPWTLFAGLFGVYLLNGDFHPVRDAAPNVYLPVSLLKEGNLSFTERERPSLFYWRLRTEASVAYGEIQHWGERIGDRSAWELYREGQLQVEGPTYVLAKTRRPGLYVGIYGPGAGLAGLPCAAPLALAGPKWDERPRWLWYSGKVAASLMAAGSAAFLYLALLAFLPPTRAAVLAAAYGVGTCVWSVASQALWQQSPVLFFSTLGLWLLLRRPGDWGTLFSGLSLGAAVACRPTAAITVAAAAATLVVLSGPRRLLPFALGAIPPILALAFHNFTWFGNPFAFAQSAQTQELALAKTGSPSVWQTPLTEGMAGHLLSPARGLLVYSPFLAAAFWGFYRAWRDREYRWLRPLTLGWLGLFLVSSKWFDWWGGWSFGYRLLMDSLPLLFLGLVPVTERIATSRPLAATFAGLVAVSFFIHLIGAFAYDHAAWNARLAGYEVAVPGEPLPRQVSNREDAERLVREAGARILEERRLDVDQPPYRARLWSLTDNPVLYYLRKFGDCRRAKHAAMDRIAPR